MRTILFLIEKEFKQIFRNKGMLPIIFIMPLIQLIILANSATYDIKNLNIYFVDKDMSSLSLILRNKFTAVEYFKIAGFSQSQVEAEKFLDNGKADLYIEIPANFERNLYKNQLQSMPKLLIVLNAINGSQAGLGLNYANAIIGDFNSTLISNKILQSNVAIPIQTNTININYSNWYNPELNYYTFMVPGILVILVTMIATFLSGMNIVREKEIGTIDQINVTPIHKYQFLIGKLTPLWILGMFELAFGLAASLLIYDIPFVGSLFVLFTFTAIYLLACLGLGLLISSSSENQQQAMFISWFIMMIFILLGGLFTAIETMPTWVQFITFLNPVRYFIEVIRLVMLKGSGFADIKFHFIIISIFAIILNLLAVIRYKKTS